MVFGKLVQGPAQGTAAIDSGTFIVTLAQTPVSGNLLVLIFISATFGSANAIVSGISQTGVKWQGSAVTTEGGPNGNLNIEMWYGVVGSGAGTVITVTVTGGNDGGTGNIMEEADVCEFTGPFASSQVDKTAVNQGSGSSGDSGTTNPTIQTSELWIGAIGVVLAGDSMVTQSSPTNSFTLLDGLPVGITAFYSSIAYCYKVVSSTGTANVGTNIQSIASWEGCIATFKAATQQVYGDGLTSYVC
jgi:hypothetical protein